MLRHNLVVFPVRRGAMERHPVRTIRIFPPAAAAAALLIGLTDAGAASAVSPAAPNDSPTTDGATTRVSEVAQADIDFQGTHFDITLTGSGEFTAGKPTRSADGSKMVPFTVGDEQLDGSDPDLGNIHAELDQPVQAWLVEPSKSRPFPAEGYIPFGFDFTSDLIPGIVLAAQRGPRGGMPALHNTAGTGFPPTHDVYQLDEPIALEAVGNPGTPLATIDSFTLTLAPAGQ